MTNVHRFTWQDLPLLLTLTEGRSPSDPRSNEALEALRRWLCQPGMEPERDGFVGFVDGTPAGYAYVVPEEPIRRGVLMARVLDAYRGRGVGAELLETVVAHGRSLGLQVIDVDVDESDTVRQASLASVDFTHVRTHWHLRRDDIGKVRVPVPQGATLRMAARDDARALTDLQNAAFAGSWGYCPNTTEEIEYRVFELPADSPDAVLLLELAGELVGYCWTHLEDPHAPGVIGMVGVPPSRQGQGLGRVVTAAGLDHLVGAGTTMVDITVDGENTPAVRLYQSLGFVLQWRSLWYELALG